MDQEFIDGFSRLQILQLYACGRCGECILACPVFEETQDESVAPAFRAHALKSLAKSRYGLRSLLFGRRRTNPDEVQKFVSSLYHCTLCGRCMAVCPYNFDLVNLWEKSRESAVEGGLEPEPIREMIQTTVDAKNFMKRPHAQRKAWTRRVPVPEPAAAETLYFVGCAISYTPTLRAAAGGVATILTAAKEEWALLGDEWCCGVPLKFGGGTEPLKEFVTHNVEMIESSGAKKVVFSCPGCLRMFKQEYPKILGRPLRFSTTHIVELVSDYLKTGKIALTGKLEETVTYHDPCELSRLLGIVEPPRSTLTEVAAAFVELPENKLNTHCCGGGGLYKAVDTDNSLEIARKRVGQAEALGSSTLVSACPSCIMNLSQAARFMKSSVTVLDFAAIVAQQIKDI